MKYNNEVYLPKPYHSSSIFWASLKKKENNTISDFRKKKHFLYKERKQKVYRENLLKIERNKKLKFN